VSYAGIVGYCEWCEVIRYANSSGSSAQREVQGNRRLILNHTYACILEMRNFSLRAFSLREC
jgi:hypothetical protein